MSTSSISTPVGPSQESVDPDQSNSVSETTSLTSSKEKAKPTKKSPKSRTPYVRPRREKKQERKSISEKVPKVSKSPQAGPSKEGGTADRPSAGSEKAFPSTSSKDKETTLSRKPYGRERADDKEAEFMSDLKCKFSRSARGRRMLSVNGVNYRVNNIRADKVRWRCSSHERFGCKAKIHTIENKVVYFIDEHITSSPNDGLDDIEPLGIIEDEYS